MNEISEKKVGSSLHLPDYLHEMDPRSIDVIEHVIYYAYQAHCNFEMAMECLHPTLIEQAEQELHEMLVVVRKTRENIEDEDQRLILDRIEEALAEDYKVFE